MARATTRQLNAAIAEALDSPAVLKKFSRAGLIPAPSTPGEFGQLIVSETLRWRDVIKATGARAD